MPKLHREPSSDPSRPYLFVKLVNQQDRRAAHEAGVRHRFRVEGDLVGPMPDRKAAMAELDMINGAASRLRARALGQTAYEVRRPKNGT